MIEAIVTAVTATILGGLCLHWLTTGGMRRLREKAKKSPRGQREQKRVVFISSGGTCRDPMAAAITRHLLDNRQIPGAESDVAIQVEGMALGPISKPEVSYAARQAIKQLLGQDLLEGHLPKTIAPEDVETADLILVMDNSLLNRKTLPSSKTYLLKEFFGQEGDVVDPWPDGRDEITLTRYFETAKELKAVIEGNFDALLKALGVSVVPAVS